MKDRTGHHAKRGFMPIRKRKPLHVKVRQVVKFDPTKRKITIELTTNTFTSALELYEAMRKVKL